MYPLTFLERKVSKEIFRFLKKAWQKLSTKVGIYGHFLKPHRKSKLNKLTFTERKVSTEISRFLKKAWQKLSTKVGIYGHFLKPFRFVCLYSSVRIEEKLSKSLLLWRRGTAARNFLAVAVDEESEKR